MRILPALLLVALGCGNGPADSPAEPAATVEARTGREFRLRVGGIARLDGDVLVAFRGVSGDSRCPIDVVCVWAGDAEVRLEATIGRMAWTAFTLHTGEEPRTASFSGRTIHLIAVEPSRRSDEAIDPSSYVVRLRVD